MPESLTITTLHVSPPADVESLIRERVAWLEHFYPRLIGCSVTVEGPGERHQRGGPYDVRLDLRVPGGDPLIVNRQRGEDLEVVLRDAFDAARRRLQDFARLQRGATKTHAEDRKDAGSPAARGASPESEQQAPTHYHDREHAARVLADRLRHLAGEDVLILAVPRGGVPLGQIVAEELGGELDVVLVHKLGAPDNPEYAIGSVSESGEVQMREGMERSFPRSWIDQEAARQLDNLRRRRSLYSGSRPPADPEGRVVVVVDDGVATGATLAAALRLIRAGSPRRLVAAVGVAPPEAIERLEQIADEVVCPLTPARFRAVGQYFDLFDPIGDEEVASILGNP